MAHWIEQVAGLMICRVKHDHDVIIISFVGRCEELVIMALGECCSISWFEVDENFTNSLTGKKITALNSQGVNDITPAATYGNCETNEAYVLSLDTGSAIFNLRNNSNGYYNGYLDIKFEIHAKAF